MTQIHAFGGAYDDFAEARGDFDDVRGMRADRLIGGFQAAIFSKHEDGKVKVVDTASTTRTAGAEWGIALGALLGILFPAGVLIAAVEGAGVGALAGNAAKGWTNWDVREIGQALQAGETGVIVITRDVEMLVADQVLPRAKKSVRQTIELDQDGLESLVRELGNL